MVQSAAPSVQMQQSVVSNPAPSIPIQQSLFNPMVQSFSSPVSSFAHVPKPRGRPPNNPIATYSMPSEQAQLSNMLLNQYMSMLNDFSKLPQAAAAQVLGKFPNPFTGLNVLPGQPSTSSSIRSAQKKMNSPTTSVNNSAASLGISPLMNPISSTNLNMLSSPTKSNTNNSSPTLNVVPKKINMGMSSPSSSTTAFSATSKHANQVPPGVSNVTPTKNPYNVGSYMSPGTGFTNMNNDLNNMFKNFFQSNAPKKHTSDLSKLRDKYKVQSNNIMGSKNPMTFTQEMTYKPSKKGRPPKMSMDFSNKSASAAPKPINIKNQKDCLPNTSALTCTVVSSKAKDSLKAHPALTSLPNITITPVQKASNPFSQKQPQTDTLIIRPHAQPAHIQTSPGKSLQEKLAEKKKSTMESKIIRID